MLVCIALSSACIAIMLNQWLNPVSPELPGLEPAAHDTTLELQFLSDFAKAEYLIRLRLNRIVKKTFADNIVTQSCSTSSSLKTTKMMRS